MTAAPRGPHRRGLFGLAGAVALSFGARAQVPPRQARIGFLSGGFEANQRPYIESFLRGMRDLGHGEGSFRLDSRYAAGVFTELPRLTQELLGLNPDVLLVATTPANLAAKAATSTVPIVMISVGDPVTVGLVSNLARPGGNITGITNIASELAGKRLEIAREIAPGATRIGALLNPADPVTEPQLRDLKSAATSLGLVLAPILELRSIADLEPAFAEGKRTGAAALVRLVDPQVTGLARETAEAAVRHKIPVIYPFQEAVRQGGLISYGPSQVELYRQAASYVHRILRGTRPAELPVVRPTAFEMVINLPAARSIGLSVPRQLLARADEIIE